MIPKSIVENLAGMVSGFSLPSLTRDAEIAVYMIHNSLDPEDYFFLFDFEEFVDRSKGGIFVRPKLCIFTGRDDFGRTDFAHKFREVFAFEFDRMRAELAAQAGKGGWLNWNFGVNSAVDLLGGFVANLILAIALSAGKRAFSGVSVPGFLRKKTGEAKLADQIDQTKEQVEAALQRIDVTIHKELYDHAYKDGHKGKNSRMDRKAWPLPGYVRTHLSSGENGAWW